MINKIVRVTALLLLACGFLACNQDPIFYTISREVPPRAPLISGGPVNFAVFDYSGQPLLFAASGKTLHWYEKATSAEGSGWDNDAYKIPQPEGRIKYLAATASHLFAICFSDESSLRSSFKRIGKKAGGIEGSWTEIEFADSDAARYPVFQAIYAPPGDPSKEWVFISAEGNGGFAILYADGTADGSKIKALKYTDSDQNVILGGELRGAAFDGAYYYMCVKGGAIYAIPSASLDSASLSSSDIKVFPVDAVFMGMIDLDPKGSHNIAAVARNGKLYQVEANAAGVTDTELSMGEYATSALAFWDDPERPGEKLLLAGRQDSFNYSTSSGYTYGYREFRATNGFEASHEPGMGLGSSTSVADNERYKSTIGKHQVNFLFQAPPDVDPEMTLFAATSKNGVWSYRMRGGEKQWNAEE